jgi:hypothetical protein
MLEQFIPLYCVLFGGSLAAAAAAICLSLRLNAQAVRVRRTPPVQAD